MDVGAYTVKVHINQGEFKSQMTIIHKIISYASPFNKQAQRQQFALYATDTFHHCGSLNAFIKTTD